MTAGHSTCTSYTAQNDDDTTTGTADYVGGRSPSCEGSAQRSPAHHTGAVCSTCRAGHRALMYTRSSAGNGQSGNGGRQCSKYATGPLHTRELHQTTIHELKVSTSHHRHKNINETAAATTATQPQLNQTPSQTTQPMKLNTPNPCTNSVTIIRHRGLGLMRHLQLTPSAVVSTKQETHGTSLAAAHTLPQAQHH